VLEEVVDHAGAVEAGDDRKPSRHGGGLVAAGFLHPAQIQLDVRTSDLKRVQIAVAAPGQVGTEIGLCVSAGLTLEPGQVGGHGQPQRGITRVLARGEELCCVHPPSKPSQPHTQPLPDGGM
jgi:hypothetical protein